VVTKDTYGGTGEAPEGVASSAGRTKTAVEVLLQFRNVLYGVAGVAVLAAVGGCADQSTANPPLAGVTMPATPPAWHEPASYKFTLKSSCGELKGTFQNVVSGGAITQNTAVDEPARKALSEHLSKLIPTLGQIENAVTTARKEGADEVVVDHDSTDGHPTSVRIDPKKDTRGDEHCFEISNYSVG
jgi:hypothetical protein